MTKSTGDYAKQAFGAGANGTLGLVSERIVGQAGRAGLVQERISVLPIPIGTDSCGGADSLNGLTREAAIVEVLVDGLWPTHIRESVRALTRMTIDGYLRLEQR